jgi:hypothetical protein
VAAIASYTSEAVRAAHNHLSNHSDLCLTELYLRMVFAEVIEHLSYQPLVTDGLEAEAAAAKHRSHLLLISLPPKGTPAL